MYREICNKMDEYLEKRKDEICDTIMMLAKYPSIQEGPAPDAPFGKPCRECLDAAVELMNRNGFSAKVYGEGRYGLANYGNGEKTIGIFTHTDVVPVSSEDWIYTEPFCPKRMGDVLVGRGVQDDKAGVAMAIYAVKLLEHCGLDLKSSISVFLGSNEESGMEDIGRYVRENKLPDVSLVPDAEFPVSFGEKGICRAHIIPEGKFQEICGFEGGTAYNIMLDRLSIKIKYTRELYEEICEKAKDNKFVSLKEEGEYISVRATGIPKHASMPEGGVNAACVACGVLSECENLCKNDRDILVKIHELTGDFYGEKLGIACCDECFGKLTSVNGICTLENGVPNIALDIRYGTAISGAELEKRILAAYPKAYIHENNEGFAIPKDDKIAKSLERVYAELSKNPDTKGFYMGGGTYARYIKNAFSIGTQAEYIENETPQLPCGHGEAHQSDEILKINQFIEAIKIMALMIHECDKALNQD